jgi:hypothetical protein
MRIRWTVRISLGVVLPLLFVGCLSNSPPEAIVGSWHSGMGEKKRSMTFWENGVWSFETGRIKQTGTYKFVSEKQLEMTVDIPSDAKPIVYKRIVAFAHHDLMHMTDVATSMRTTWKRGEQ